jgi:Bacterial Ig domain
VQFKLDGVNLGAEDTTAPYSVSWDTTTATNGTHTLTAVARDAAGNTTTSAPVTVTVGSGGDTTPPTAAITSPSNGAWTGNSIHIVATGSDNVALASLKVYGNGGVILQKACTGTSCTLDDWWTTGALATGAYQIQAVATDTSGNCGVSAPVTINKDATTPVKPSGAPTCGSGGPDTTPPSVAVTSPTGGSTVSGTVTVSATASDNVGVVGVQFKLDGGNLGAEDTTAPYAVSWNTTTATPGSHTLTAVARDAAGNSTTSSPVTVTVSSGGDTTPPTAAITAPSNGAWTGNSIHIVATAGDNVGLVSVKVYGNGGVILQKTCSGTSCTLDNWWTTGPLATGAYQIQAVATDTSGNCTVSAPVTINKDATSPVKPSGAPSCGGA